MLGLTRNTVLGSALLILIALEVSPVRADPFGSLFTKKKTDASGQSTSASLVSTLSVYTGPKKRLAVMPLEDKTTATGQTTSMMSTAQTAPVGTSPGTTSSSSSSFTVQPPSDFGSGLTEMLTTELSKTNRFVLLERQDLTDVTNEQTQDAGVAFDPASAPKAGGLLGAQILIRGAITEYSYNSSGTSSQGLISSGNILSNVTSALTGATPTSSNSSPSGNSLGGGYSSCKAKLTIDLRIVDAVSGEIIDSVEATGSCTSSSFNLNATTANAGFGTNNFNDSPLGAAVRQAIDSAVYQICTDQSLNAIPWECEVADMDSSGGGAVDTLYLDSGSNAGLKVGDVLTVMKPGRTIISPETRVVIGRTKDTVLGHCHVDSVEPDLAVASVVDGAGFAVGNVLRFPSDIDPTQLMPGSTPASASTPDSTATH